MGTYLQRSRSFQLQRHLHPCLTNEEDGGGREEERRERARKRDGSLARLRWFFQAAVGKAKLGPSFVRRGRWGEGRRGREKRELGRFGGGLESEVEEKRTKQERAETESERSVDLILGE